MTDKIEAIKVIQFVISEKIQKRVSSYLKKLKEFQLVKSPNEIEIGHRDSANQVQIRDPALISPRAAAATSYPGGHNEGFGDTFKQLFVDFYRMTLHQSF